MSLPQFPTLTRLRVITCNYISAKLMISRWRYLPATPERCTTLHALHIYTPRRCLGSCETVESAPRQKRRKTRLIQNFQHHSQSALNALVTLATLPTVPLHPVLPATARPTGRLSKMFSSLAQSYESNSKTLSHTPPPSSTWALV
jgi:hypothetical protein